MSWLKRLLPRISTTSKKGVPEGVWTKCPSCLSILYQNELQRLQRVCPKCRHHLRISARERLNFFMDEGTSEELGLDVVAHDRLSFKDSKRYKDRIYAAQKSSGESEALLVFKGKLKGMPIVAAAFEFKFIGGSMSAAVGQRFVLAVSEAIKTRSAFICFSASGGARMQEGLFSLFQMARTSAVLARLNDLGLPFISILCDPTMGGVSASLATLGDIIIAEPKALIGFSGPRVIEQTIREVLPNGFQRSEFLLDHGAVDMIVDRLSMRDKVYDLLQKLNGKTKEAVSDD